MDLQSRNTNSPTSSGHVASHSQDTKTSDIAESTISVSQFPQPPASIPSTPTSFEFVSPVPRSNLSSRSAPLRPRRPLPVPDASNTSTYNFAPKNKTGEPDFSGRCGLSEIPPPTSLRLPPPGSPYNRCDGASSIGVDMTEDRLFSTSFITSLLKENSTFRADKRQSSASDALSSFSEITYPPLASSHAIDTVGGAGPSSSKMRLLPHKAQAGRPPLSSFVPIDKCPIPASGNSTALYRDDQDAFVPRKAGSVQTVDRGPETHDLPSNHLPSRDDGRNPVYSGAHALLACDNSDNSTGIAIPRLPRPTTSDSPTRNTIHSTTTVVSSFASHLSPHHSIRRVLGWKKVKPLPPVPLIAHIPIAMELEHRRAEEMAYLSDLANRANTLERYLEKGYQPHQSIVSYPYHVNSGGRLSPAFGRMDPVLQDATGMTTSATCFQIPTRPLWDGYSKVRNAAGPASKRRTPILLGVFLILCLAAVGTAVGIAISHKKASTTVCTDNLAGAACNLNATCVCTSTQSEQCDPLAQNIIDLVPNLNRLFFSNRTSNDIYNSIRPVQSSANCASQSVLVDVAPALMSQVSENVTSWAQTALLWNIIESQNLTANAALQKFIQTAPWHALNTSDETSLFTTTESGFIFDFAAQKVREPNISFVAVGQPTDAQLSQIRSTALSALDRMYSFASASSTQHQKALENYWTGVLQRNLSDLQTFITALSVSPILLPFDATLTQQPMSIGSLLTPSSSAPFPPPLSCYPGLSNSQLQLINAIEGPVFGLSSMSSANRFDPACYPDRPIYGVLNVLRLRQPFLDPRSGIARQAAVLNNDVSPRVIIRNGAILSLLPGPSNVSMITVEQSDPRKYGTLGQFHHVALQYLSSIPRVEVAIALVSYILASASIQAVPPASASILFSSISTIPIIEVAVFGTVSPSDISSAGSAFTTSSGSLFFGSDQGTALRNWVITGCSGTTIWAESPVSPLVVRDNNFSDRIFNATWDAVSIALHDGIENVGLVNITDAFTTTKKYTSS